VSVPPDVAERTMTPELTLTLEDVAGLAREEATEPLSMDEPAFRAFYARTAAPLRSYLSHLSGEPGLADDLLQEAYYRFLRAALPEMDETHRKNYLYRVATNLVRDHFRSPRSRTLPLPERMEIPDGEGAGDRMTLRADVGRAFQSLKPRHRELLWLAYVEGSNHKEIAERTGMKVQSVRPLLFRARQKLAEILRASGFAPAGRGE
jgi:RNA polymerase sigma-70 factor, ECF subfamily